METKNKKICSVTPSLIGPVVSSNIDCYDIKVSLLFRRFHEIHLHCKDADSPSSEDHNVLWKELHRRVYKTSFFIAPKNLDTIERHVAEGLKEDQEFIPQEEFGATPGVFSYVTAKVSEFIRDYIDVALVEDVGGLSFKVKAMVDVSTVDFGHDDVLCS